MTKNFVINILRKIESKYIFYEDHIITINSTVLEINHIVKDRLFIKLIEDNKITYYDLSIYFDVLNYWK